MKILFTRHTNDIQKQDYLADQVFSGLHSLGHEVTDTQRLWYLYRSEFQPWGGQTSLTEGRNNVLLYGCGFSYAATLDENPNVNRDPDVVRQRIRDHYYDLVIIGRPDHSGPYADLIFQEYGRSKIILLDGRDDNDVHPNWVENTTFFKRELFQSIPGVHPISFALTSSKVRTDLAEKTQPWGTVVPGRANTYVFNVENDYYDDYARSLFAHTTRKSGWDCMRHYEILGNRCIPYFHDLEHAPAELMKSLPRDLLIQAKQRVDQQGAEYFMPGQPGWSEYCELEQKIHSHFMSNCTTEALAKYILECWLKYANYEPTTSRDPQIPV